MLTIAGHPRQPPAGARGWHLQIARLWTESDVGHHGGIRLVVECVWDGRHLKLDLPHQVGAGIGDGVASASVVVHDGVAKLNDRWPRSNGGAFAVLRR